MKSVKDLKINLLEVSVNNVVKMENTEVKFKSAEQFKIAMLENKYNQLKNRSFSKRFGDIAYDMNEKFSKAVIHKDLELTDQYLKYYFDEFLSVVYDKEHDNLFCGLELRDNNKDRPALVLSVDADTVIRNALELEFALRVFLEEWYPDLQYGDIYTEWV